MADATGLSRADLIRLRLQERSAMGRYTSLADPAFDRVIDHVGGDMDMAVEVMVMRPWPKWLRDVLFPGRTSKP